MQALAWAGLLAAAAAVVAAPAIDPDEGRPHVRWEDAGRVVGRVAFVYGKVERVEQTKTLRFLKFDAAAPERFEVVIGADDAGRFGPDLQALYQGKNIRVRGMVSTYRGLPQIRVSEPSQIAIIDAIPASSLPPARAWSGDRVTIATYNVLNLFDDADDPYRIDETVTTKPRDQLEALAATIRDLNADVIAFEEVENRGMLERFIEVFLPDAGYEHVVLFEGNDVRDIDVALVSRIPVGVVHSHRHVPFPGPDGAPQVFERDLLCVELTPPGTAPFEVWVVHLKSNYEGREYAEPYRLAEAREVRRLLDQRLKQDPQARIILCGDFNDVWDSETLQTIVGSGPLAMKCFAEEVPEAARITYNRKPYLTMIDYLLFSPALAGQYEAGTYRILTGPVQSTASDHNPVVAQFRLK